MYCISLVLLLSISAMAAGPSEISPIDRIKQNEREELIEISKRNRIFTSDFKEDRQLTNVEEREKAEEASDEQPQPSSAASLADNVFNKILPNALKQETCSNYSGPEYDNDPLSLSSGSGNSSNNVNSSNSGNNAPGTYSTLPKFEGIVSRQEAGLPPSKAQNDTKEKTQITIHHSEGSKEQSAKDIYDFHTGPERNWGDIAYHFIISKSGGTWKVYEGRPLEKLGSHVKGNNAGNIGIMITGDYREKSSASNPNSPSSVEPEAISLLEGLVDKITDSHNIDGIHAHGKKHAGDMGILEGYDCPGAGLVEAVEKLRIKLADKLRSKR